MKVHIDEIHNLIQKKVKYLQQKAKKHPQHEVVISFLISEMVSLGITLSQKFPSKQFNINKIKNQIK